MDKTKCHGHYVPHVRVQTDGTITCPHTGEITTPPSMTKQEFAAECDVNNIIKQYTVSGMLTHINAKAASGQYVDLPDELDYQDALNVVIRGEEAFASLPAKIRERFHNEPAEFLAFSTDPANLDEMRNLGLAPPAPRLPETPPKEPDVGIEKKPKASQPDA